MCDRFFPDEPEYDIEILEWIVERMGLEMC